MVSYILLLAAITVLFGLLALDPSSVGRTKPMLAPVLRLIPGYAGDLIEKEWFRNAGLITRENIADETCRLVPGPEGC
jgi:hypothetical protein